jgi:hypothetical protein
MYEPHPLKAQHPLDILCRATKLIEAGNYDEAESVIADLWYRVALVLHEELLRVEKAARP